MAIDVKRILGIAIYTCLTILIAVQASAAEFEKLDQNSSLRIEEWWRVATDDGLDRIFFNATFRNDGPISKFLANLFDYKLTMTSGETYKGTITASECYFDFGWDPWSSPCGDSIQPGAMGEAVIGFRKVNRQGYPNKLTILVRDTETVVKDFKMPETITIGIIALIVLTGWATQTPKSH